MKVNQGISIIRDFSAGSNATTMLCMDDEKTFFRKYAFEEDGKYYWGIENYDGTYWEEISKFTYTVLLRQSRRILRREKSQ